MDRQTLVLLFSASALYMLLSSSAVLAAPPSQAAPSGDSCTGIVQPLTPCMDYVTKIDDKPSQSCCDGAKKLNDNFKTRENRRTACQCIKQALTGIFDVDAGRIPQIPRQCGTPVTLPPIDSNFDCSRIAAYEEGMIF